MSPCFQCTESDETTAWQSFRSPLLLKSLSQTSNHLLGSSHGHRYHLPRSLWALLLFYLLPRRVLLARFLVVGLLLSGVLMVTMVWLWLDNEVEVLVLSPGIPLITKEGQRYPELLTRDISSEIPAALQRDWYWRSKSDDGHKVISKQASPLKLLSLPRRQPVCAAMLRGDRDELDYALRFMETTELPRIPLSRYQSAPDDCEEFVRSRGYIQYSSREEKEFPLAFSMMMYCDVEQAERLLRSVWRPQNYYCIHIDAKADSGIQKAMQGIAKCLPNVFLASKQNVVNWAAYNSLTPWVTCMNDLWKFSWKYFINLTGQEFPLKTNLQLVKTLKALKGTNIVDATTYSHYSRRWYEAFPAPHNIHPYKGLVFIIASRGFVNFTIHAQEAKDLLQWLKYTDYPDETFFSSINHNPHLHVPGSYKGNPDTNAIKKPYIGRFVNWGTGWRDESGRSPFSWPCGGKRVRGICIFGIKDMPLLINRKELFVNKFHLNYQPLALDCMEEWHFNMTIFEYSNLLDFNTTWYSDLDLVKNRIIG